MSVSKTMLLLMMSSLAFHATAGNSVAEECALERGEYLRNVVVSGVNVISNWQRHGPAFNMRVGGVWHVKRMDDNADKGFYQLAYMAYITQEPVNVCVANGYMRSIEFSQLY